MITLVRKRTATAVNAKYRGIKKRQSDKVLLTAQRGFLNDPDAKHIFDSAFWKTAKTQLKKESNGKCAYCEANTQVVAHGDVEHYRPKSVYWWLAYTYDNYLYACQICNQIYKKDHFPIDGILFPGPIVQPTFLDSDLDALYISPDPVDVASNFLLADYILCHQNEIAQLINPYFDDPTIYFAYEADDILKEVRLISTDTIYDHYVKAAEDYYGLNRIELKNFRYAIFTKFRALKHAYDALSPGDVREEVGVQIQEMISEKYLFAGMNRYFDVMI